MKTLTKTDGERKRDNLELSANTENKTLTLGVKKSTSNSIILAQ